MPNLLHLRYLHLFLPLCAVGVPAQAADWLQFGYDPVHSGNNVAENGYTTASGNQLALSGVTLAHQTDSAPILVSAIATPSGTKDLLLVVALDGTLSAFDAATGAVVWSKRPTPASGTNSTMSSGGVTGAPAVDPARQYAYAYGLDGNVHKYNVADGSEVLTNGTSTGKVTGWPQISTLKPEAEKGAASMAIAGVTTGGVTTNYLYAPTNGYGGDQGDYQGHLTTINLSTSTQNVFNVACSDQPMHFDTVVDCSSRQNGIWGRPGAIYDPGTNQVLIATANGPYDANNGGSNWGDSVLALHPDGTGAGGGQPVDSYTPSTYLTLQNTDADLGSNSPALLPAPAGSSVAHLAVQGGKDGCVRLLNLDNLSGAGGPGHIGGELQAVTLPGVPNECSTGKNHSTFKTQAAVWINPSDNSTWTFVGYNTGIVGYQVTLGVGNVPQLTARWSSTNSGTSPVIANDTLYYVASNSVRALDPVTGNLLWSDSSIGSIHWQSPIVANGRLYVIDSTSKLWVYQLDGVFRGGFQ
jgi:hypothetical protein